MNFKAVLNVHEMTLKYQSPSEAPVMEHTCQHLKMLRATDSQQNLEES